MQLWLDPSHIADMAAVTAICAYPTMRVLSILLVGGKRIKSWHAELVRTLGKFGRANAWVALEASVRPSLIGAVYKEDKGVPKGWDKLYAMIRRPI